MTLDDKIARAGYMVFSATFSQENAMDWTQVPPSIRETWKRVARAVVEEFAKEAQK